METKQKMGNTNKLIATQNLPNSNNGKERMWIPNTHNNVFSGQNNELNREKERQGHEMRQFGNNETIDLTSSTKRNHSFAHVNERELQNNILKYESDPNSNKLQKAPTNLILGYDYNGLMKKRGRKRKYAVQEFCLTDQNPNRVVARDGSDTNEAEILKAAKSLFSKRTRTLYHWMYPDTPKAHLKAAVESSWETLRIQEKDFYISQVLGPFGFPQVNVMLNPQLGCLPGSVPIPALNSTIANEESSSAVSGLYLSERSMLLDSCMNMNQNVGNLTFVKESKKRHRLGRPPGSKNRKSAHEDYQEVKSEPVECTPDEFQDDPELCQEFQQFKWTLHLNDNDKN